MSGQFKHGQVCFNELSSSNLGKVTDFYQRLFGWGTAEVPAEPGQAYTFFQQGSQHVAGARPQAPFEKTPNWVPYVWVDNVAQAVEKAAGLGGKTLMPVRELPGMGTMAFVADPEGAVFGLWKGV